MKFQTLSWQKEKTPGELISMLNLLEDDYPIKESSEGLSLIFKKHEKGTKIIYRENEAFIYYDSISSAARSIGTVLSEIGKDTGAFTEESPFETFGILIECSRNAILTVDYFKQWLKRLSLMGCNLAMLYTKDAYELPGEDYFGYLRGRYTLDELREIDDFASKLGIEMIGCIQALGHLEPVLRWPAYASVKDTSSVLLTTEEKSYELVDKMMKFYSKAFKSRRIHLGMDETHDLGRGTYMDKNGYRRGFDIYNDHLSRISGMCKKHGLSYMIWSDMYFRMGSKTQNYYDKEAVIPEDVKEKIPKDAQLVYWDYYHKDEEFYIEWIKRHKALGFPPFMASGIWTWGLLWHNHKQTEETVGPCISACIKEEVKELVFTAWGDDGMLCDFDSAQAGLCYAAEKAFAGKNFDEKNAAKRFKAICGGDYGLHKKASEISDLEEGVRALFTLWDDPLLGIHWKNQETPKSYWQNVLRKYAEVESALENAEEGGAGDISRIKKIVRFLKNKIDFKLKLDAAYEQRDFQALGLLKENIQVIIDELDELIASFRSHWNKRYKSFGFEFVHVRLGGQKERFKELSIRIDELLSGKTASIPELDEKAHYHKSGFSFQQLATGSYFI